MPYPQPVEEALEELRRLRREQADLHGVRERAMRSAYAGGASLRTIGEAAGVSKDTVRKIVQR